MKRSMCFVLILFILIMGSFTSCSKGEKQTTASNNSITTQSDLIDEQINITFPSWYWGYGDTFFVWLNKYCEKFMDENKNVTIEPIEIPYEEYWDKIDTAFAANTPYDIMMFGDNIGPYIENKLLLPLNDYIDMNEINTNFDSIQTLGVPALASDGKTYAISLLTAFYAPIYRPTVLQAAGFNSFPQTYEEFLDLCAALKANGIVPYGMMINPGNYGEQWLDIGVWVHGCGGSFTADGKPNFLSDEVKLAYSRIYELYNLGYIVQDIEKASYRSMFGRGELGILIDGPWCYGLAVEANPECATDFKAADTAFIKNFRGGWEGPAISAKTKYPQVCADLLMSLVSKESMKDFTVLGSMITTRKDIFDDSDWVEKTTTELPWFGDFRKLSGKAISSYPVGLAPEKYSEFQKIAGAALENILYGGMYIDEALKLAQNEAEILFAN